MPMVFKEPINKKKFLAAGQTKCANELKSSIGEEEHVAAGWPREYMPKDSRVPLARKYIPMIRKNALEQKGRFEYANGLERNIGLEKGNSGKSDQRKVSLAT